MKKILLIVLVLSLMFILSTCFFAGNTSVSISPEIRAIGLPTDITSVELIVSGPGMNTIGVVYDGLPSSIDINVPSGSDRTFELIVYVDTPIIAATSYKGKATVDLSQGNAEITLSMGLGSTRLIVPDSFNNRLLQFDDISDSTAEILLAASLPVTTLNPYDVDFDNEGRIYIANSVFGADGGFIRVENIIGTNPFLFGTGHNNIDTLTVDRYRSLIYYSDGSNIYRSNLDGNFEGALTITNGVESILTIEGMTIAGNGLIYITGTTTIGSTPTVFQYNPDTQKVTAYYTMPNAITIFPWDVCIKETSIYVTNPNGADGWKIIQLNYDLTSPIGYGINKTTAFGLYDTSPGHFYNPRRFAAILNKEISIIDDYDSEGADKLVSIDNITGANWKTLPTADKGQGLFEFFYGC